MNNNGRRNISSQGGRGSGQPDRQVGRTPGGQSRRVPNTQGTRRAGAGNNTQMRRPYDSRRPTQNRRNNGDAFFYFLLVVIGIAVIAAVVLLVSYMNGDKRGEETESASESVVESTNDASDESSTDAESTEQTGAPAIVDTSDSTTGGSSGDTPTNTNPLGFKADLSAYEEYMNPTGKARDEYLLLVNPKNPLASNYVPSDLVSVKSTRKDGRTTQKLREYAAKALEALMLEADACGMIRTNTPSGYPLSVMSAYRSYEYQGQLFNTYVNNEMKANPSLTRTQAENIVATYSCRAGTSEHQSGLCVDMHTLWSAGEAFKNEPEAKWLVENCYKFGFILRFPADKTKITEITYEPWHFRYVGRYHATKMHESGMCLEEYVASLNK